MFNPHIFENSRPDGFGVMEIVPPEGQESQHRQFVPLKSTELKGEIAGPVAGLRLVQTFSFTKEQCARTIAAVYRFPLPGDAAVTGVWVRFGDVEIRAHLKEREEASSNYAKAKQEGRKAALVTRESPDVFTLHVAGLQPGQDTVVETCYVQQARAEGAGWSLRTPLTTSPRYVRQDEVGSRHAEGQPLALLRDPGHRFRLNLLIRGANEVTSNTHALTAVAERAGIRVQLRDGEVIPDRDCLLAWRPTAENDRPTLQLWMHDDPSSQSAYFMALVTPPHRRDKGSVQPREVILLVDHSGSMSGPKWQAADWAVEKYLTSLNASDRFNLGLFHNTTRWWKKKPQQATQQSIEDAVGFLKAHRDNGGTELGVALEQALSMERAGGNIARHVLLITDAEVSDAARILRLADVEAKQSLRRRISLLCIDAAPNAHLATELAERGGGVSRFLTSNPSEEDIATSLDEILADWSEPVLVGLKLEVNRTDVHASGRTISPGKTSDWAGIDLGDLPAGRPVWVVGRLNRGQLDDLAFRVTAGDKWEIAACKVQSARNESCPALKPLFGARRLQVLEYLSHAHGSREEVDEQLRRLGIDPTEVFRTKEGKLYAENAAVDVNTALKNLLVHESLCFGLACSETAFIAERKVVGQTVESTEIIANALPEGWSDSFLGAFCGAGGSGRMAFASAMMAAPMPAAAPPKSGGSILKRVTMLAKQVLSELNVGGRASNRTQLARDEAAKLAADLDSQDMRDEEKDRCMNLPSDDADDDFDDDSECELADHEEQSELRERSTARDKKARKRKAESAPRGGSRVSGATVFTGVPSVVNTQSVLFDSTQSKIALPSGTTFTNLEIVFDRGVPAVGTIDSALSVWIFVDDMVAPRAKIGIADLVRQGGVRPLNILRQNGQVVRIVLVDPNGAWSSAAPAIGLKLNWA